MVWARGKGGVAQPIDLAHRHSAGGKGCFGAHDHAAAGRIKAQHINRLFQAAHAQAFALAHSVMDNAVVQAQNIARLINNLAGVCRAGAQLFDHGGIVAVGHKANVLTVGLISDRQAIFGRQSAGFGLGAQMPQGKAQVIQLVGRGGKQEIALIAVGISRTVQLRP